MLARGFRSLSLPARGAFHLSLSVLFLYRSLYVFSLGPWSARIRTEFLVFRITWVSYRRPTACTYEAFTLYGPIFQLGSVCCRLSRSVEGPQSFPYDPSTPTPQRLRAWHGYGLGFAPFAHHYSGYLLRFLFLRLLRCFTSPGCRLSLKAHGLTREGCPIQISAGRWMLAPYRGFSQLATSFFGIQRQGIPLVLFVP